MVRRLSVDLQEEEAKERKAGGTAGQKHEEIAGISWKEQGSEEGEEKGTEAERSQWKRRSGTPMMWPIQSRRLDSSREGHTASQTGEERKETQQGDGTRRPVVRLMQGKVADSEANRATENCGPRAAIVDEYANGDAHGVHAQVSKETDQVALG